MKNYSEFIIRNFHYLGFALLALLASLTTKMEYSKWGQTQQVSELRQQLDLHKQLSVFLNQVRSTVRGSILYQNPRGIEDAQTKITEIFQQIKKEQRYQTLTAQLASLQKVHVDILSQMQTHQNLSDALKTHESYLHNAERAVLDNIEELESSIRLNELKLKSLQVKSASIGLTTIFGFMLFLWFLAYQSKSKDQLMALLNSSERLHRLMFSSMSDGIILCTADGYISTHNRQAIKMLNLQQTKIRGLRFHDLLPKLYDEQGQPFAENFSPLNNFFITRKPVQGVLVGFVTSKGKKHWLSLSSQPLIDENEQDMKSVLISISDITESVEKEKLIEEQRSELVAKSKLSTLGEMASGIAHEINNPLAMIIFQADNLEDLVKANGSIKKEDISSFTEKISSTVFRISKIIHGVRAYARNADQDDFVSEKISPLIEDALALIRHKLKEYVIDVQIDIQPENLTVDCRSTQIVQVIVNIVSNAIDAISEQESGWIKISAKAENQNLILSITNSGPVIPPSVREKLFKAFFTTKTAGRGTGLGLSLSRNLAIAHGGDLILRNDTENTCFELTIPLKQSQQNIAA